ncbi:hypothetical protein ACLKA6_007856 [Drosophila palustris]
MAAQRHASFATTTRQEPKDLPQGHAINVNWLLVARLPGYQLNAQNGANTILDFQQSALIKKQTKIALNITHTPCGTCEEQRPQLLTVAAKSMPHLSLPGN